MTTRRIILLAHNIRSLWNVGSLFRTCDAFGVEKFFLTGYTGFPPRKEITKTALGAERWVAWKHVDNPIEAVNELRCSGYRILALEQTTRSIDIGEYDVPEKICLVLGNEVDGIDRTLIKQCDDAVEIQMLGNKESLNVSVAAGVALYRLRFIK